MPWAGPVTPTAPAPLTSRRTASPSPPPSPRTRPWPAAVARPAGAAARLRRGRAARAPAAARGARGGRRRGGYGPVAGIPALREAAAGYWTRRGLPTEPGRVVAGPGSKPLLYAVLLAIGTDVAVPSPSWVSYAAQTQLTGARPHFVPAAPGEGGICDPAALDRVVTAAAAGGRLIRAVIATLPDNPTGTAGQPRRSPRAVRGGRAARPDHHLRRDLPRPGPRPRRPFLSPARSRPSARW